MLNSDTLPLPVLRSGGDAALDLLLEQTIAKKEVPSIFWAATNADKVIYQNQAGNVVFGDEASGTVNPDTSERSSSCLQALTDPCFSA